MTYENYVLKCCDMFPNNNFDIISRQCAKPEFLKLIALELFLARDCNSEISMLTHKKLLELFVTGFINFED